MQESNKKNSAKLNSEYRKILIISLLSIFLLGILLNMAINDLIDSEIWEIYIQSMTQSVDYISFLF